VCTSPLEVSGSGAVPCGQCLACRIQKASEWAVRCMHERSSWNQSSFATLTYRDEDLKSSNLDRIELTKFIKRLRKAIEPRKLRYYACGEYGEIEGRPHYHAILFGIGIWENALVEKAWGHGMVHMGTVTMESVRYTADYIGKAISPKKGMAKHGIDAYRILTGQAFIDNSPPFAIMSQGLGREFLDKSAKMLKKNQVLTVEGKQVPVPRYYWTRLGFGREVKLLDDLWVKERRPNLSERSVDEIIDAAVRRKNGAQIEKNKKAKVDMFRKGIL
jgi:hypothetical protein